mmetsp:Transcript_282/g.619  ORF Transcript_282/g.619 Transcript_282/m.619 type:complete len:225 (+) Transcript_282:1259-1933(+)
MLHPAVVQVVLVHGNLRAIEHTWFVHVVPDVKALGRSLVLLWGEQGRPPLARLGVQHIEVHRGPRPAPAIKHFAVMLFHQVTQLRGLLVEGILFVFLDVRINNGYHLPSLTREILLHHFRVREVWLVPGHVAFAIRVLNVQPNDVAGDRVLIKLAVHTPYVSLVLVIPPALVVAKGKELGHAGCPGHGGILLRNISRAGSNEKEHVDNATLRNPLRMGSVVFVL